MLKYNLIGLNLNLDFYVFTLFYYHAIGPDIMYISIKSK